MERFPAALRGSLLLGLIAFVWLATAGMRQAPVRAVDLNLNGLAVLNEVPDLARYYGGEVIGGSGSFLMTASDFHDFATAIRLNLVIEIRGAPLT